MDEVFPVFIPESNPVLNRLSNDIQPKTKLYNHLALQFSDFQLKSFVDPKPVEL